jgi:hypothetical protein
VGKFFEIIEKPAYADIIVDDPELTEKVKTLRATWDRDDDMHSPLGVLKLFKGINKAIINKSPAPPMSGTTTNLWQMLGALGLTGLAETTRRQLNNDKQ